MAAALARPGVEVVQVFRSTAPTVITPTLVPCVVGVCKQIVDVLSRSNAGSALLNGDALVTLPALVVTNAAPGTPAKYTGFDGLNIGLSINNGPEVVLLFSDPTSSGLSPTSLVSQIAKQFATAGVTEAVVETVGTDRFRIRSVGIGEFQSIEVTSGSAAVLSALGLAVGQAVNGLSAYNQYKLSIHQMSFPDPRRNLTQLAIESSSIRAFLALGNGANLLELKQTESFLRRGGTASAAVLTGSVDLTGLTFSTVGVVQGTANVTAGALYGVGGTLDGLTLRLNVNGAGLQTLTFNGTNSANQAALLAAIDALWPPLVPTVGGSGGNKLVLTNTVYGPPGTIVVDAGSTSLTALGLTAGSTAGLPGTLANNAITFATDGNTNVQVTFVYPHDAASVLSQINGTASILLTAAVDGSNHLTLTSPSSGATSEVEVVSGTGGLPAAVGFTAGQTALGAGGVAAVDDGNGDAFTPMIRLNLATLTTAGAAGQVVGTADTTAGGLYGGGGTLDGKYITLGDGRVPQRLDLGTLADQTALLAALNGFFGTAGGGGLVFTIGGPGSNKLVVTSTLLGDEGIVDVVAGDALAPLGLTVGKERGTPFPPAAGDQLYVDGKLLGRIVQVAPGGAANTVKVDKQVPINAALGVTWYVVAKNLSATQTSTRPSADLGVDLNGNLTIKHGVLRDTTGAPVAGKASLYVSYRAVRRDVSSAYRKALVSFDSPAALTTSLSPVSVENPLALGLYFALLNAPGIHVTGIGVDAIANDAPYGTVEAFARAASFLEAFEVYALAPLTHDSSVGQVFNAHVSVMSQPEQRGERICLFNPSLPTTKIDTLVASGTNGNGASSLTFDTGIVNLSALLLNQDIDPTGTISVETGLFLNIASDSNRYSIESISGGVVTIRTTFAAGENDDSYYATTDLSTPPLPATIIEETFAIRIRGETLVSLDGTVDKQAMAETLQLLAQTYLNRRFWHVVPDKAAATLDGLEQEVEGFYLCAAIAGMIGQQPPQQSFTNFPMTGFTQVVGSNGFFSEHQLDIIAAGGNYIVVQDAQGAPLTARMALTTDRTSLETQTDSITKIVDFAAKFMRRGLRNFIGRFNVTQGFLDALSHVIQGLLGFLTEIGVLIGADLNNIIQDESSPDTVLVDVTLDVPFPCNYIRLTLTV